MSQNITLEELWKAYDFNPNEAQRRAILHSDGPLYLPAGPGSGKTRVLLWRTLNLIVFHGVKPEEIFLSTFTEKAARQLREGIASLLGDVQTRTGRAFDLGRMYVGTVHSLCQKLIRDRRFYPPDRVVNLPALLDELNQHFFIQNNWTDLLTASGFTGTIQEQQQSVNQVLGDTTVSQYKAISNATKFFNRCSEENLKPALVLQSRDNLDANLRAMLQMYHAYLQLLNTKKVIDFSSLQGRALQILQESAVASRAFRHVIIDEYQDTNPIQERIFFELAKHHQNICVVGDDDQAMYRFRGATVENFVTFPETVQREWHRDTMKVPLDTNYRSHHHIVQLYNTYMGDTAFWSDQTGRSWRVGKQINPHNPHEALHRSVAVTTHGDAASVGRELAATANRLIATGKVNDPNEIAVLFPSLKNERTKEIRRAFEEAGLKVYAPRAGRFLEVEEARDMLGVLMHLIGKPEASSELLRGDFAEYMKWCDEVYDRGAELIRQDPQLTQYMQKRQTLIHQRVLDRAKLLQSLAANGISTDDIYNPDNALGVAIKQALVNSGASSDAMRTLSGTRFDRQMRARVEQGRALLVIQLVARATTFDFGLLDVFYQLLGFRHFKKMLDEAQSGGDEGPICNLAMVSQYLSRFLESQQTALLSARDLTPGADSALTSIGRRFWMRYVYVLYRNSESEYEDEEMMFPRGRVPFLTVHQSKGLEFPVVMLANPNKQNKLQHMEVIMRSLVDRLREPEEKSPKFDSQRLFYVALSRAKHLCVIGCYQGRGTQMHSSIKTLLSRTPALLNEVMQLDLTTMPKPGKPDAPLPKSYSYTADYIRYQTCPRQYMLFHKYEFAPSRTPYQMFGSLVHRSIDEIHNRLIAMRQIGE
jgi:DNA helicase II / ATP-dependent DNA helicase PcrA